MARRWVIRTGNDDQGTETHIAFLAAGLVAVPAFVVLVVVAARTSGLTRLLSVLGAVALGLLIVWTGALLVWLRRVARRMSAR